MKTSSRLNLPLYLISLTVLVFGSTIVSGVPPQYELIDLGSLGGRDTFSLGWAINNAGQVAGGTDTDHQGTSHEHAFLYSNGSMIDLGTLGGTYSEGHAVNDSGQVTGEATTTGNTARHAFLYSGGSMIDVGGLPNRT